MLGVCIGLTVPYQGWSVGKTIISFSISVDEERIRNFQYRTVIYNNLPVLKMMLALCLIVLGVCPANTYAAPAEALSFDYGWRFFLGDPATPPTPPPTPPSPPPPPPPHPESCRLGINATFPIPEPKELSGLTANKGVESADACGMACCAAGPTACWAWQYHSTKVCWMG